LTRQSMLSCRMKSYRVKPGGDEVWGPKITN
jgi:hypothetical protein